MTLHIEPLVKVFRNHHCELAPEEAWHWFTTMVFENKYYPIVTYLYVVVNTIGLVIIAEKDNRIILDRNTKYVTAFERAFVSPCDVGHWDVIRHKTHPTSWSALIY